MFPASVDKLCKSLLGWYVSQYRLQTARAYNNGQVVCKKLLIQLNNVSKFNAYTALVLAIYNLDIL